MLTLRGLATLLVAGLLLQPAAAAQPEHITYVLGGVMSGPFRIEGDLATGEFTQANPPPGQIGDGSCRSQNPIVGSCAQPQIGHGGFEHASRFGV